jgi:hypothetical protein
MQDFKSTQYAFAAHIRNPDVNAAPDGIEDRRMGVYRELFFNNVEGFLSSSFPVLRSLYTDEQWLELARSFYHLHRCQTPYFLEISRELIDYLQSEHVTRDCDPPFIFELAHYEWAELALSVSEQEIDLSGIDVNGDLLMGHPVMSPLAWLLTYAYPVHGISEDFIPESPSAEPTCIIAYRDENDEVQFTEVNVITAKLIQLIESNNNITSMTALESLADELQGVSPEAIVSGGKEILEGLRNQGIILGTRQPGQENPV